MQIKKFKPGTAFSVKKVAALAAVVLSVSGTSITTLTQVFADDKANDSSASSTGNQIKVATDSTALQAQVDRAKKLGIDVPVSNKSEVISKDKADSRAKEVNKDQAAQAKKISTALDKYEADLKKYNDAKNAAGDGGAISSDEIIQNLKLGQEKDAKLTISNVDKELGKGSEAKVDSDDPAASSSNTLTTFQFKKGIDVADALTATYTGLKNSYYKDSDGTKHKITKIVRHITDVSKYADAKDKYAMLKLYNNPTDQLWYYDSTGVTAEDTFYDENGKELDVKKGTAYLSYSSLNAWYQKSDSDGTLALEGKADHVEKAIPTGENAKAVALVGSSIKNNDGKLFATQTNSYVGGDDKATSWDFSKGNWDNSGSKDEFYGTGVGTFTGGTVKTRFETERSAQDTNMGTWVQTTTGIPETEIQKPELPKLDASITELLVTSDVKKDVQAGNTDGSNQHASIDGQEVKNGTEITYTIQGDDLPANRVDDLTKNSYTDELPKEVTFEGAKVYSADNKDITTDWQLTNEGQKITAVAKDTYLATANQDKTKAFKQARLVIHAKVNADNADIKNTASEGINDGNSDSNTTDNTTKAVDKPTPAPAKDLPTTGTTNPIVKFFQKLFAGF